MRIFNLVMFTRMIYNESLINKMPLFTIDLGP